MTNFDTPKPDLKQNPIGTCSFRLQNQQGIQLLSSSNEDGSLYCRVQRDARTTVNGKTFDLVNDKFHLLVAAGMKLKCKNLNLPGNVTRTSLYLQLTASGFTI